MARRSSQAGQNATQRSRGRSTRRPGASGSKDVVRPIGRPTALTDQVEETIIGLLIEGNTIADACALAGVHQATYHRWMQRGEDARDTLDATGTLPDEEERFRDFRESVLDARAQASTRMVKVVMQAAHGGFVTSEEPMVNINGEALLDPKTGEVLWKRTVTPPNANAALRYLQLARPKDWSVVAANAEVTVKHTGADGTGPVEVVHGVEEVRSLSERLMEVRKQFEDEAAEDEAERPGAGQIVTGESWDSDDGGR